MKQLYEVYNMEDFEVWKILFERQQNNLSNKACPEYLDCLQKLNKVLNSDEIPHFDSLSSELQLQTGWAIEVVPGMIPVNQFFEFLANKKFPSSTWLRMKSQLDYLEEPDMFHDIFGHVPLLMNPDYAKYMEEFGKLGVKYGDNKNIISRLQSLYWFTIEFGLLNRNNNYEIYGAGIISSFGETNHIFGESVHILPFNLQSILKKGFVTSEIQNIYFELNSFDQLYQTVNVLEEKLNLHSA